jgi:hypothetical protein
MMMIEPACLPTCYHRASSPKVYIKLQIRYKERNTTVSHSIHLGWSIEFSVGEQIFERRYVYFARGTILFWTHFYIDTVRSSGV